MKWTSDIISKKIHAEIEKQRVHDILNNEYFDWYYLYIYDKGKNVPRLDYQRETLDQAKSCALSNFDIPLDSWKQIAP